MPPKSRGVCGPGSIVQQNGRTVRPEAPEPKKDKKRRYRGKKYVQEHCPDLDQVNLPDPVLAEICELRERILVLEARGTSKEGQKEETKEEKA